ncbi:MAG: twin-arginine translocase subunit TatC [Caldilineaceae bacterium]|nr:twin-arginine translocase subunit TatC [Caldilineaceae bacterium]
MLLPAIMLLFLAGAAFAFFVMLPVAVGFLQTFLSGPQDVIKADWAVDRYISLVTRIVFWIAVSFETPLVFSFLARIGLVSGPALLRFWRHAIVVIAILAAAITPTIDPVNMAIVMGPLFVLYMMSVGLAYLLYRPRDPRDFSDDLE